MYRVEKRDRKIFIIRPRIPRFPSTLRKFHLLERVISTSPREARVVSFTWFLTCVSVCATLGYCVFTVGPSTHSTGLQSPVLLRQHSAPQLLPRFRRHRRLRRRRRFDRSTRYFVRACVRTRTKSAHRSVWTKLGPRSPLNSSLSSLLQQLESTCVTQSVFRIFNRGA